MSTANDSANDAPDRPCSIDLTLELERQLDNDSLPPSTPAADAQRPQSLDTQVVAHIVTDLRSCLAEVTRHRDELANALSQIQASEKDLTDTLAHMTDKCSRLQEELDTANSKAKDDENTISVLRTKVEESRRGLMRLQSESRRQSQVPSGLDLSRASLASLAGPQTSKRASFAPLTGSTSSRINAHRRISSVSDSGFAKLDSSSPHGGPGPTNFTSPDNAMLATKLAYRSSGIFARASSPPLSVFQPEESSEAEILRRQFVSMRAELEEAKHELNEANEAREASELCVKALRVFIEENNVGASMPNAGGSAAPPPSLQAEPKKGAQAAGGWAFKLWRTEPLSKTPSSATPTPFIPPTTALNNVSSPPPTQPLSRKLGEFFGARSASISSTTPVKSPRSEQEAMYNGLSDTSSIEESLAEPVSPASELPRANVLVRDTTSVASGSSARDLGASPERKTGGLPSPSGVEEVLTPVAI